MAKRARIAHAALELFRIQGYAQTTFDQIAAAARVSRRTVFHHFPTKDAVLFDHFVVRHEAAVQHLRERPVSESSLVSVHAVLRELAELGYDRRLLTQIRTILTAEPLLALEQFSMGSRVFEQKLVTTLQNRRVTNESTLEILAVTKMALGWFTTAAQVYLTEGRPSLVECFDEVVATCQGAPPISIRTA
ncbi:MAG: TetR/AcrR family transcriptional regulator [Frankia sp.]